MTRDQMIAFLATMGSLVIFRIITKLIPPKTIKQRDRERLALELMKSQKASAKELKSEQADTARDLRDEEDKEPS
jgi:hypothetical protein